MVFTYSKEGKKGAPACGYKGAFPTLLSSNGICMKIYTSKYIYRGRYILNAENGVM